MSNSSIKSKKITTTSKAIATTNTPSNTKNGSKLFAVFAIIVGILIMFAGYSIYKHFDKRGLISDAPIATVDLESLDTRGIVPIEGDSSGIVFVNEFSDDNIDTDITAFIQPTSDQNIEINDAITQPNTPNAYLNWSPNNYNEGDISTDKYEVVSGDTLWEIAEGAYGDGIQWNKIAQANNVDYLANGNPLIIPGQILTIP